MPSNYPRPLVGMVNANLHWIRTFASGLTYLVYPKICWVCSGFLPVDSTLICAGCARLLVTDPESTCPRCSSSVGPYAASEQGCIHCKAASYIFDHAFRLGPYEGLLREVILRMKQPAGEGLADAVAGLWAEQLAVRLKPFQPSVVIPVPLHWTRWFGRGYNQSEALARPLAKKLQTRCQTSWVRRRRRTAYQTHQPTPAARQRNVHGAFSVRPGLNLKDQIVVLVDDVMTTGATLNEIARALKPAQPAQILVAVLAHGR